MAGGRIAVGGKRKGFIKIFAELGKAHGDEFGEILFGFVATHDAVWLVAGRIVGQEQPVLSGVGITDQEIDYNAAVRADSAAVGIAEAEAKLVVL